MKNYLNDVWMARSQQKWPSSPCQPGDLPANALDDFRGLTRHLRFMPLLGMHSIF